MHDDVKGNLPYQKKRVQSIELDAQHIHIYQEDREMEIDIVNNKMTITFNTSKVVIIRRS